MEIIAINVTYFIVQNIVEMMLTHLKTEKEEHGVPLFQSVFMLTN